MSGGPTPQTLILASRNASFNEVLARCLGSFGSEAGSSPSSKPAAAVDEQTAAPFIPINTSSLGTTASLMSVPPLPTESQTVNLSRHSSLCTHLSSFLPVNST